MKDSQKYISFTKYRDGYKGINFRFIDSIRFMPQSLDAFSSYLRQYPIVEQEFASCTSDQIALLKKKGVY